MNYAALYVGWGSVGIFRGVKLYSYENHNPFLYSHMVVYGLGGLSIYSNPILLPWVLHKEVYRMEVQVRGLEKTLRYYEFL